MYFEKKILMKIIKNNFIFLSQTKILGDFWTFEIRKSESLSGFSTFKYLLR